jgi:YfiH family protein
MISKRENQDTMSIVFKIFDKTFPHASGKYGTTRFKDTKLSEAVHNNHLAIMSEMKADKMLITNHVFGTHVVDADRVQDFTAEPDADAAVTTLPGLLLTIQTADCVPVMLASDDDKVIGAAHCSWHTAKDNILARVVSLMKSKGARNIRAIIGPAIHQKSYEVDQTFYESIIASESKARNLFASSINQGRFMFDLPGFCLLKLNQLGITDIHDVCEDTYEHPDKYYSYRRDVHQGNLGEESNILSTIMIEKLR